MPDDPVQPPARREPEPQSVDFDVIDDDQNGPEAGAVPLQFSPEDMMRMGSEMMTGALTEVFRQQFKKLFIRLLIIGGPLALFATEHGWARVCLVLFGIFTLLHLGILLFGWHTVKKRPDRLMRILSRFAPPGAGLR